ncbi:MAG: DUF1800 domain-containing protein [Deltaproteobacteria bacterium]|nr:DUF1800 domain-containing protein [Deltaproteobacteria bacterium]
MSKALGNRQAITHFLNRVTYGPRPGDVERVQKIGLQRYLDQQLKPETIPDRRLEKRLAGLKTLSLSSSELLERFPPKGRRKMISGGRRPRHIIFELQAAKLLRAVYSNRQLYEVMADFWMNHFNVFAFKGADKWLITAYEQETIRPHSLGRFHDLLLATAQSPAMLFYLDNWLSVSVKAGRQIQRRRSRRGITKPNPRRGLNENYAREILELHTLGVDGGFTQRDVEEVARCFTGWTIWKPWREGKFHFDPRLHDRGEKHVLGVRIPPGRGIEDGMQVIDLLARHPSTARFIATKLLRRFVSDDPSPPMISKIANAFQGSGGDIRSVVRTLVESPGFLAPTTYRAKVKKPLELVSSALRALGAETDQVRPLLRFLMRMGEPLFLARPPTGYPDVGTSWIGSDALLTRINFAIGLTANRIPGTRVNTALIRGGAKEIIRLIVPGEISQTTSEALAGLHHPGRARRGPRQAAFLMASPEFQRR